jgi:hypothetical protein
MVERSHRQLKDALRARLAGSDWFSHLPWVLLGLRAVPKEDTGVSSAELVLGAPLTLPGEFLSSAEPPAKEFLDRLRRVPSPPPRGHYPMLRLRPRSRLPSSRQSSCMSGAVGCFPLWHHCIVALTASSVLQRSFLSSTSEAGPRLCLWTGSSRASGWPG